MVAGNPTRNPNFGHYVCQFDVVVVFTEGILYIVPREPQILNKDAVWIRIRHGSAFASARLLSMRGREKGVVSNNLWIIYDSSRFSGSSRRLHQECNVVLNLMRSPF